MSNVVVDERGVRLCLRYAYGPNSLHYCGPEQQIAASSYLAEGIVDYGLVEMLHKFETLYPYLSLIASCNDIKDPFDRRVVQAYWLGNTLLKTIGKKAFGDHLAYGINLKKKLSKAIFSRAMDHGIQGVPNHNFHVMNIYIRTGHHAIGHTLSAMDQCRISWGRLKEAMGSS